MTITINGKTVEPVFNFGTVRIVGEITKNSNPITFNADFSNPPEVYRYAQVILMAALKKAKVPNVTESQVQDILDDYKADQLQEIISRYYNIWKVEANPEGEQPDPQ